MKIDMNGNIKEKPNTFKQFCTKIEKKMSDILFPANIKCLICGRDLLQKQEIEFCDKCKTKIDFITEEKCCKLCGSSLEISNICLNCKSHKREFEMARSVAVYDGDMKNLIINFKFNNKPYIYRTLGHLLVEKFKELNWKIDIVIPVPLTNKRRKSRGYNQAELIANVFCEETGLPLNNTILVKTKDTEEQVKLGYKERQENIQKTFKATNKNVVKTKNILIIDDVFTTGATTSACALTLKESGANKIYVLCVASTKMKMLTTQVNNNKKDK